MQTILNLSGVRVHVGFERVFRSWHIESACVVDDANELVYEIDDIDTLGIMKNGVFHSVRTLAEEWIDGQSAAIELADKRSAIEARNKATGDAS